MPHVIERWACVAGLAMIPATWGHARGQQPECLPPTHTLQTAKERLLEMEENRPHGISTFVGAMLTPRAGGSCPILQEDVDLQHAAEELTRFVTGLGEGRRLLQRGVLDGLRSALSAPDPDRPIPIIDNPWNHTEEYHPYTPEAISLPMEALTHAVEQGATRTVRGLAMSTLASLDEPRAFEYVLRWARARRGPPGYPNLPEQLASMVYPPDIVPTPDSPLRRALESDPSRIMNPTVRCWAELGRRPSSHPPPPQTGQAASPCPGG